MKANMRFKIMSRIFKTNMKIAGKYIAMFAIILAIAITVSIFAITLYTVDGYSMGPTLNAGDVMVCNKLAYKFSEPKRNDIITFKFLYLKDTTYIKRVIGLPGETIQIIDGNVYINGEMYYDEKLDLEYIWEPGLASEPITLGEDEYFVLGDNRNNSDDSRHPKVAKVKKSQIIGRAFLRISPIKDFTIY